MNNEIKEILEIINFEVASDKKWVKPLALNRAKWKQILDYINNLYLDNTLLKLEKDIYKQGYEELKELIEKTITEVNNE